MQALYGFILFGIFASACSPKNTSEVRTVDNFGKQGEGLTENSCGWDLTDKRMPQLRKYFAPLSPRIITTDAKLKDVVFAVLAHTPRGLRMSFFALDNTTIELVSDVATYCSVSTVLKSDAKSTQVPPQQLKFLQQSNKAGTLASLPGCWQTSTTSGPRVIIKADAQVIRNHLLRMMAFIYTELLRKNVKAMSTTWVAKAPAAVKTFMGDMVIKQDYQRRQLAAAFFKDLAKAPAKDQTTPRAVTDLKGFYKESYDDFADYLFAEAVDSYFCSSKTYSDFAKNYSLTQRVLIDAQVVHDLTRVGKADEFSSLSSGQKTNKN